MRRSFQEVSYAALSINGSSAPGATVLALLLISFEDIPTFFDS